jgi:hypothetical protein
VVLRLFDLTSSSRLFIAVGTGALLVLIVILLSGGFVLQIGPLRLSARSWQTPLVLAIVASALGWRAAAWLGDAVSRHATALAVLLTLAIVAMTMAYGTYSAAGADAAGYVSQAHLIASGTLVQDAPLARRMPWPDATWSFAPLGYRPGLEAGTLVPTYPSGLPLLMAAFLLVAGDNGPYLVAPVMAALVVLGAYALGTRLHSRVAGLVAAALLATSPIVLFQAVQPMSDVPVTALWTLTVLFALTPARHAALAAGACAGLAILTRPNLLPFLLVVLLARPSFVPFIVGLLPAAGALALVNWRLYGSPIASGYGDVGELFSLGNVAANTAAYGNRIAQGEWPATMLALGALIVFLGFVRLKAKATGVSSPQAEATTFGRGPFVYAVAATIVVLACYLPYGVFAEWSYLRFLLPAFPFVFVAIGAVVVRAVAALPPPARGVVLLAALTAVCAANVEAARREQAFNLHRYESRYRDAGRYLQGSLPLTAVVITSQHSASAAHYGKRPILRWDLLPIDLDAAIGALRAAGRTPVLLVEDWEVPALQSRHPRSRAARLDGPPRAEFGAETRVWVYEVPAVE